MMVNEDLIRGEDVAAPDPDNRKKCVHCHLEIALVAASATAEEFWVHYIGGLQCSSARFAAQLRGVPHGSGSV